MNKTRFAFVALALLTMLPAGASAQLDISLRGGVNLYKLTGDSISAADSLGTLKGINIGVTVAVPVSDLFSVQIGLAYSQQGTAASDFFGDSINAKVKNNYIDIPILAKISPSMDGALGVDFFVGPSIGFNIGCKLSSSSPLSRSSPPNSASWGEPALTTPWAQGRSSFRASIITALRTLMTLLLLILPTPTLIIGGGRSWWATPCP